MHDSINVKRVCLFNPLKMFKVKAHFHSMLHDFWQKLFLGRFPDFPHLTFCRRTWVRSIGRVVLTG